MSAVEFWQTRTMSPTNSAIPSARTTGGTAVATQVVSGSTPEGGAPKVFVKAQVRAPAPAGTPKVTEVVPLAPAKPVPVQATAEL